LQHERAPVSMVGLATALVDGRTREVTASIAGSRNVADYRVAIDEALVRGR
jgi:hypothetical protein